MTAAAIRPVALEEMEVNIDRIPAFVMEFIRVCGPTPPPDIASGGCDPDGSRGREAVERWW
jgi:hypothetical protein